MAARNSPAKPGGSVAKRATLPKTSRSTGRSRSPPAPRRPALPSRPPLGDLRLPDLLVFAMDLQVVQAAVARPWHGFGFGARLLVVVRRRAGPVGHRPAPDL